MLKIISVLVTLALIVFGFQNCSKQEAPSNSPITESNGSEEAENDVNNTDPEDENAGKISTISFDQENGDFNLELNLRSAEVSNNGTVLGEISNQDLTDLGILLSAPNKLITSEVNPNSTCPTPLEPVYARLNMADGTTTIELNLADSQCGGADFYNSAGSSRLDVSGLLSRFAASFENP